MNRSRRKEEFFVVLSASGAPAISNCGCARMPNWMLAPGISTRIGPGGGANGTYGARAGTAPAAGASSAAGGGAGGTGLGAGLAAFGLRAGVRRLLGLRGGAQTGERQRDDGDCG